MTPADGANFKKHTPGSPAIADDMGTERHTAFLDSNHEPWLTHTEVCKVLPHGVRSERYRYISYHQ